MAIVGEYVGNVIHDLCYTLLHQDWERDFLCKIGWAGVEKYHVISLTDTSAAAPAQDGG
jgi:hypothetical protein